MNSGTWPHSRLARRLATSLIILLAQGIIFSVDASGLYAHLFGQYDLASYHAEENFSSFLALLQICLTVGEIITLIQILALTWKRRVFTLDKVAFAYAWTVIGLMVSLPFIYIYLFFHLFTGTAISPSL